MTALALADRMRLIGALQLAIEGATEGKQLAACAHILHARRLRWPDLIVRADTVWEPEQASVGWRGLYDACLRQPDALTPWEQCFLHSLLGFNQLSVKRLDTLYDIAVRVGLHWEAAR